MYHILSHSDSEYATTLQEVLKMSISILQGLAAEWALLHQVDKSWFKFKTVISDVCLWTSPDVGTGRSWEIIDALLGSHQCGFVWRWWSLKFVDNLSDVGSGRSWWRKPWARLPYHRFWIRMVIGQQIKSDHATPCEDHKQTHGSR
jgi:hypothetical protein